MRAQKSTAFVYAARCVPREAERAGAAPRLRPSTPVDYAQRAAACAKRGADRRIDSRHRSDLTLCRTNTAACGGAQRHQTPQPLLANPALENVVYNNGSSAQLDHGAVSDRPQLRHHSSPESPLDFATPESLLRFD